MDSRLGLLMPTGVLLLFLCHTTLVQSLPTGSIDCSERQFEHPNYGRLNCSYYCSPNRTLPGQIEFCNNVCPKYYIECGAELTTSISISSTSTHRPAVSSKAPTASPHISDTSKTAPVEATTVTAISEHGGVESSTIPTEVISNANQSELSTLYKYNVLIILVTILVIVFLFFAGIAIWRWVCKKRKRSTSSSPTTCNRRIYTVPFITKKSKQLHAQETRQSSEPDYYEGLLPSLQFYSGQQRASQ